MSSRSLQEYLLDGSSSVFLNYSEKSSGRHNRTLLFFLNFNWPATLSALGITGPICIQIATFLLLFQPSSIYYCITVFTVFSLGTSHEDAKSVQVLLADGVAQIAYSSCGSSDKYPNSCPLFVLPWFDLPIFGVFEKVGDVLSNDVGINIGHDPL